MALKFYINNLDNVLAAIKQAPDEVDKIINNGFQAFSDNTVNLAKELCPVNEGTLRGSIEGEVTDKQVIVGSKLEYAAYLEFGTKSFAEQYVGTLPSEWQQFANEYKGQGGGSFDQLVMYITMWVHDKGKGTGYLKPIGITGTYSLKTRKRTGSAGLQNKQDMQAAYLIARKILRVGIPAQPYLYPAFEVTKQELIDYLTQQLTGKS
jgi:hypothetical protein